MYGLMMDRPLLITAIMRHAERNHGEREIVSITADHPRHRTSYRQAFQRARRLANAVSEMGVRPGDRIATLAFNDYRHFELYYAISCSGCVCHTVNPRLFAEQLVYIINHAEDRIICVDPSLLPLVENLMPRLPSLEQVVVLTDAAHMPSTTLPNAHCYEDLIDTHDDEFEWPELDERQASSLCYTSGTTGNPKGVLYSHRSTVLHAFATAMPDVINAHATDVLLPVVPMFHANAWNVPYAGPMVGASLVLPGPHMGDAAVLSELINREGVTMAMGVPTVWLNVLAYCRENKVVLDSLQSAAVGGAACPPSLMDEFRERHGVQVHHSWGMTEMSPVGTYNAPKANRATLPPEQQRLQTASQGRSLFGVELKITDDANRELPWDGASVGALKVRGPCVCCGYYRQEGGDNPDPGGWFDTGDVASIDADGFLYITDRSKDVIKSGGEWISSIELENIAMAFPGISEAAVIGVPHPKWSERPLLLVIAAPGAVSDPQAVLEHFRGKVAKWWIPDAVEFITELPHTPTGKVSKLSLRQSYQDYRWPDEPCTAQARKRPRLS